MVFSPCPLRWTSLVQVTVIAFLCTCSKGLPSRFPPIQCPQLRPSSTFSEYHHIMLSLCFLLFVTSLQPWPFFCPLNMQHSFWPQGLCTGYFLWLDCSLNSPFLYVSCHPVTASEKPKGGALPTLHLNFLPVFFIGCTPTYNFLLFDLFTGFWYGGGGWEICLPN